MTGLQLLLQKDVKRFIGLLLFALLTLVATLELRAQTATLENPNSKTAGSLNYYRFENIKEVISNWSPNQHLYVKGDLGLSPTQLLELEGWLHKRGHWTAILIQDSSSQR